MSEIKSQKVELRIGLSRSFLEMQGHIYFLSHISY